MESGRLQALWMRWVCSMYSEILWRKLSGSLNTTGMAILDNSYKREATTVKRNQSLPHCDSDATAAVSL